MIRPTIDDVFDDYAMKHETNIKEVEPSTEYFKNPCAQCTFYIRNLVNTVEVSQDCPLVGERIKCVIEALEPHRSNPKRK